MFWQFLQRVEKLVVQWSHRWGLAWSWDQENKGHLGPDGPVWILEPDKPETLECRLESGSQPWLHCHDLLGGGRLANPLDASMLLFNEF